MCSLGTVWKHAVSLSNDLIQDNLVTEEGFLKKDIKRLLSGRRNWGFAIIDSVHYPPWNIISHIIL